MQTCVRYAQMQGSPQVLVDASDNESSTPTTLFLRSVTSQWNYKNTHVSTYSGRCITGRRSSIVGKSKLSISKWLLESLVPAPRSRTLSSLWNKRWRKTLYWQTPVSHRKHWSLSFSLYCLSPPPLFLHTHREIHYLSFSTYLLIYLFVSHSFSLYSHLFLFLSQSLTRSFFSLFNYQMVDCQADTAETPSFHFTSKRDSFDIRCGFRRNI